MKIMMMGAAVMVALGVAGCEDPEAAAVSASVKASVAEMEAAKAKEAEQAAAASAWNYTTDRDEMRDAETKFASLYSVTEVPVQWPYTPRPAELTIRRSPQYGLDVIIQIDGQFTCHFGSRESVSVKFDDGPVQSFPCAEPADGSPGVLFINRSQGFLTALKGAKKVIIEMPVYEAGQVQVTWEIPTPPEIS